MFRAQQNAFDDVVGRSSLPPFLAWSGLAKLGDQAPTWFENAKNRHFQGLRLISAGAWWWGSEGDR
jgi:hypothetical protein